MRIILLITALTSLPSWATTVTTNSSTKPCELIIHDLRAGGEIEPQDLLSKMQDVYKAILIPSLTPADLEGLLASPLEFKGWSNPTTQSQVREILDFLNTQIPRMNESDRIIFIQKIAPAIIRKEIKKRNNAAADWNQEKNILDLSTSPEIAPLKKELAEILNDSIKVRELEGLLQSFMQYYDGLGGLTSSHAMANLRADIGGLKPNQRSAFLNIIAPSMIEQRLQIRRGDAVRWQELQPSLTETSSTTPEPIFESQWPWVISPIDQKIYVGSRTGRIDIRHAKPLKNILYSKSFRGHNGEITKLAISSDGKTLYSGGVDGTVRIWDLKTRKMINYLQERTIVGTPVKALAISLDEKTATFSTSNDTMVVILDPKTKTILDRKTIYRLRPPNPRLTGHGLQLVPEIATSLAFSPDGLTLFLSEGDSTIVVWNKKSAKIIYRLESPQSHITALTVSPDGKTLYSDAADKTRRSWNIPSSVMPEEDPR